MRLAAGKAADCVVARSEGDRLQSDRGAGALLLDVKMNAT